MNNMPSPNGYSDVGYIKIQAQTASGAIPVAGATVTITGQVDGNPVLYSTVVTDSSGKSEKIALPAPSEKMSLEPGNPSPYAKYTVKADAPGYYTVIYEDAPVFPKITSLVEIYFVPVEEGDVNPLPQIVKGGQPNVL